MNPIAIIPKVDLAIRTATMADLPFMDGLQKRYSKALGFFPRAQMEGYLQTQGVLIAEADGSPAGYIISKDRYLKRDELGVIFQLCVEPGVQRKLVGAALVQAAFERSAYGCRLYCCWCAQDLDANYFWESLGFAPVAFRAGSTGKRRVHIFWQKKVVEGDTLTRWWYPSQTAGGAIRADRLVFPIPPDVHWKDVQAVALPTLNELPATDRHSPIERRKQPAAGNRRSTTAVQQPISRALGLRFQSPGEAGAKTTRSVTRNRKPPAAKIAPKHITAARELRDRYLERINSSGNEPFAVAKYSVARRIEHAPEPGTAEPAVPQTPGPLRLVAA